MILFKKIKGYKIEECRNCKREIKPKKRQCPYCGILNPTVKLKDIFISLAFILLVMSIFTYIIK